MKNRKHTQNLDTYSTWRKGLSSELEARFAHKPRKSNKSSVLTVAVISVLITFLASVVTQLIAMSQFSTLGYEIERLQARKSQLSEEASQLKTAIATYKTTEYYQAKATEKAMVKPEKMVYLQQNP